MNSFVYIARAPVLFIIFASHLLLAILADYEGPIDELYTHHLINTGNNLKNPQRGLHRVAVFDEAFANGPRSQNSSFFYFNASRAQDNEDVWLFENLFFGMKNGIIIESGALDGLKYSTSFIYENLFGYEAIHIEADPQNFKNLLINRPNSSNIHAGLCGDSIRALHYVSNSIGPVRGFLEFMSPEFFLMWHSYLLKKGVDKKQIKWDQFKDPWIDPLFLDEYIDMKKYNSLNKVKCVYMDSILHKLNLTVIDIWVLDTEGSELSVLHSTNFSNVIFNAIAMECSVKSPRDVVLNNIKMKYLEDRGYRCMLVQKNCMCKHSSYIKHEISNKTEDRTVLASHIGRKKHKYVDPAFILV